MKQCIECGGQMPEWPATEERCDECREAEAQGETWHDMLDLQMPEPVRAADGRVCDCEDAPCCGCYDE